jgi:hypothetical protein
VPAAPLILFLHHPVRRSHTTLKLYHSFVIILLSRSANSCSDSVAGQKNQSCHSIHRSADPTQGRPCWTELQFHRMAALSLPYDSTGDYPISTCRYDGETNQYKYTSFQRGSTRNKSPLETHSTSSISRPSPYQPKPLAQSSRPRPKFSSQLSNAHSHPQILTARLPTVKLEDKMSQSPLSPYGGAGRGHYQPPPAHPCRCDRCTGAGSGTGAGLVLYNGATPYCHCCPPYSGEFSSWSVGISYQLTRVPLISGQISVVQHGPTNLPPERYNTLESPWKPRKQRDHSLNIPPEKVRFDSTPASL